MKQRHHEMGLTGVKGNQRCSDEAKDSKRLTNFGRFVNVLQLKLK